MWKRIKAKLKRIVKKEGDILSSGIRRIKYPTEKNVAPYLKEKGSRCIHCGGAS